MAELTQWAWAIWLVLIALFLVIEMLSLEFTFLMLALGSTAGLISSFFGVPLWGQAVIAAIVALLLLVFVRPPMLRRLRKGSQSAKFGVQTLPGMRGVTTEDTTHYAGQVKLDNGDIWTARTRASDTDMPVGTAIMVESVDGAIVRVVPAPQVKQQKEGTA